MQGKNKYSAVFLIYVVILLFPALESGAESKQQRNLSFEQRVDYLVQHEVFRRTQMLILPAGDITPG